MYTALKKFSDYCLNSADHAPNDKKPRKNTFFLAKIGKQEASWWVFKWHPTLHLRGLINVDNRDAQHPSLSCAPHPVLRALLLPPASFPSHLPGRFFYHSHFADGLLFSHQVLSDSLWSCELQHLPILHYLPEFTQTHVRWVSDAIQPSHSLSPPSPFALNLSQHQGRF